MDVSVNVCPITFENNQAINVTELFVNRTASMPRSVLCYLYFVLWSGNLLLTVVFPKWKTETHQRVSYYGMDISCLITSPVNYRSVWISIGKNNNN